MPIILAEVIAVIQPCSEGCPLSEALIAQVARLTGVEEDVIRVGHGLPVHHRETAAPRRVILQLPPENAGYGRAAFLDSLAQGEAPIDAAALRSPNCQETDDWLNEVWGVFADATVVYADLGVTTAMQAAVDRARMSGRGVEIRYLGVPWESEPRQKHSLKAARLG